MKYLIFYDSNGNIYFSMSVDEAPAGLERFTFDVPVDSIITGMDLSDPSNPKPITEVSKPAVNYEEEIENLQAAIADLYENFLS